MSADGVWEKEEEEEEEAVSAEEKVNILDSLESVVPDIGGVAVIALGNPIVAGPVCGDTA